MYTEAMVRRPTLRISFEQKLLVERFSLLSIPNTTVRLNKKYSNDIRVKSIRKVIFTAKYPKHEVSAIQFSNTERVPVSIQKLPLCR